MKLPFDRNLIIAGGLLALIAVPRLLWLDRFATTDEPAWVLFGANFFRGITHREFQNTVYEYHPAVTTLWILAISLLSYFPGYRIAATKYYEKYAEFERLLADYQNLPRSKQTIDKSIRSLMAFPEMPA